MTDKNEIIARLKRRLDNRKFDYSMIKAVEAAIDQRKRDAEERACEATSLDLAKAAINRLAEYWSEVDRVYGVFEGDFPDEVA